MALSEESRLNFQKAFFKDPMHCLDFSVYQLGEIYSNRQTSVEEHTQFCHEISFIASGKAIMYKDGIPFVLQKGDCFLSLKGEKHKIESDSEKPPHFCFVGFSSEDEKVTALVDRLRSADRKLYLPEAEQIFGNMIRESFEETSFVGSSVGCYLYRLLILLARKCGKEEKQLPDASQIYRIMAFLQNHYSEPDAIGCLSDLFFMNDRKIAEVFRNAMGESLRSYFVRLRMEKAAELLRSGQTVTETAAALGYSSIHPFSRAYKTHFGVSPKNDKRQF